MIIKLYKSLNELKIGIIGTRKHYLADVLENKKIRYTIINNIEEINNSYDIIFGSGIYKIIKEPFLSLPKYGLIFFHETPLPEGRGNAPLQWTILNNRKNLTVTAFKAEEKMDAGDYLYQYNIGVDPMDTLQDIEKKRKLGIKGCFDNFLDEMQQGYLIFRKQSGCSSISSKRKPEDSELDCCKTLKELWDNIRVCNNDEYPAFFIMDKKKVILRYEVKELE